MIRVNADLRNPGQFFACCGLLELAFRLDANAEGHFDGTVFELSGDATTLLRSIGECCLDNTMGEALWARLAELKKKRPKTKSEDEEQKAIESRVRNEPLLLARPFHLRLDWWNDDQAGGSRFKTWAGQQSVLDIARTMKAHLSGPSFREADPADWLSICADGGVPFYFDAAFGGQSSALDVGFSGDPLGFGSSCCPLLEFAALVGLQRCRPTLVSTSENQYQYTPWTKPMGPMLAAVATAGHLPATAGKPLAFRLLFRTKYLKSFLPATPAGDAR